MPIGCRGLAPCPVPTTVPDKGKAVSPPGVNDFPLQAPKSVSCLEPSVTISSIEQRRSVGGGRPGNGLARRHPPAVARRSVAAGSQRHCQVFGPALRSTAPTVDAPVPGTAWPPSSGKKKGPARRGPIPADDGWPGGGGSSGRERRRYPKITGGSPKSKAVTNRLLSAFFCNVYFT